MTGLGFREFGVSPEAVRLGARLGLPDPATTIATMARAHVPTHFGKEHIRHGIFIMRVEGGVVVWIGLGPASWRTQPMYFTTPVRVAD